MCLRLKSTLLLSITIFLCSCLSTQVLSGPTPAGTLKLNSLNTNEVTLRVKPTTDVTLGHQFLFVFIPFGQITLPRPEEYIYNEFFKHLVVNGFRVLPPDESRTTIPTISIELKEVSETAYDLIFLRWIRSHIEAEVTITHGADLSSKQHMLVGRDSHFSSFAFQKELESSLSRAAKDLAENVTKQVNHRLY